MTKREIIYLVLEKLNAHSDDSNIPEELISALIDNKRSLLLKQRFSKASWNIPISVRQEICMSLELSDVISGYSGAGKLIKTVDPLPMTIKIKGWEGPLMVRKEDGTAIHINVIPIERLPYLGNNKYTNMLTYLTLDMDNKLMLISSDDKLKFLKKIRVTHVFESPDDIFSLECKENNSSTVEPWDLEYPIEGDMTDVIVDMVVKDLAKQLPEDKINNATDDRG